MKQNMILSSIIDEIFQLENYIQSWRDNDVIPSIEKDLVQRKLQEIYEQVLRLNTSMQGAESRKMVIPEVKRIISEPEITAPGPVQEIVFEKTTEIIQDTKPFIQEIPLKTEPVKKMEEISVTKTEIETENIKETREVVKENKEILAEKLTHSHKLIHETVKLRSVMDVSSKIKSSPIPSIQSAINLNDKFLFIRELFKNNNLLYNQTIERLNNANSFEEAISIINKEFAWDTKDTMVIKLIELVKRKHNA